MTREKFLERKRAKIEKAWRAWNAYRDRMASLGFPPLQEHELVENVRVLLIEEADARATQVAPEDAYSLHPLYGPAQ